MAWIWHLSVNFGFIDDNGDDAREAARRFCETFDDRPFPAGRKQVTLHLDSERNDSGCEAYVVPWAGQQLLNGHGGPQEPAEVLELNEAASVLYYRLREMKGYRYAVIGVEVGDWKTWGELAKWLKDADPEVDIVQGIVVEQYIYDQAGQPKFLVPFVDGYWWAPWTTSKKPIRGD